MDPTPQQITAMAEELSALAKSLECSKDPGAIKNTKEALVIKAKNLIGLTQDPLDAAMDHIGQLFLVCAIRALIEIGMFGAIPVEGGMGVAEIAERCKADEALILRLMRPLTAAGIFTELGPGRWAHNRLSMPFSTHPSVNGKYFFEISIDEMIPAMLRFHLYMRKFGKQDVQTYTDTPHSWVNNKLGSTFWEVLNSEPGRLEAFSRSLSVFDNIHPVVGIYPFEQQHSAGHSADRTLAVDIGGGHGLAMLALRKGCPSLQGKLVVQDIKEVLDTIPPGDLPGVELMPHDFFTPQPVKGAQIYYVRRVFHDWRDEEARKILSNIVPAMARDSRIIISDMALPEPVTARDSNAIWLDLMMLTIGGKERTKKDWERLVESAGLKLVKFWQTQETGPLVVVECALPDDAPTGKADRDNNDGAGTELAEHVAGINVDGSNQVELPDREP